VRFEELIYSHGGFGGSDALLQKWRSLVFNKPNRPPPGNAGLAGAE
jgi:hypothetical protein